MAHFSVSSRLLQALHELPLLAVIKPKVRFFVGDVFPSVFHTRRLDARTPNSEQLI
jgi:hypothetical protein